jgi:CHAT domain-containing protein
LTRPLDQHLDSDELDALVTSQAPGVSVAGRLSEESIRKAQRHIESCQDCDRKVQMHRSAQSMISLRANSSLAAKGANCSGEMDWVKVAAGLLEETEAKERMNHAAQCGHCGPLLKAAAKSLSDETTPDEEALLAQLASGQPAWQAQMASTLRSAATPQSPQESRTSSWKTFFHWPRPLFAAGLAVLVLAVWIGLRVQHSPSVEQLLAQAYTEHRTMEVRIPGAKYAQMNQQRGVDGSSFDKPQSLLKAEDLIGEKLRQSPNDAELLDARARAELLDGNYEDAISILKELLDVHPDYRAAAVDLASAYYRRASSNPDRREDYGIAVHYLREAVAKTPDDPVPLFNLALSEEHYDLYEPAREDWQRYLTIDPTGPWSDEARANLQRVEEKIRKKQVSLQRPLLSPSELASIGPEQSAISEIDDRAENYLHVAITQWLPEAFPQSAEAPSSSAFNALKLLARVLSERHYDDWLLDVLKSPHGRGFAAANASLAASVLADDRGDYLEANQEAQKAVRLFHLGGDDTAELRAEVEELYSYHLLYEGTNCVALGNALNARLRGRQYGWLSAQTGLERSNCAGLVGDQKTVLEAARLGTDEAKRDNYVALELRGLGFQADAAGLDGNIHLAISLASHALDKFWSTEVDLMKGYNLYTDLDTAAETLRLPYLQVALWQQATALIDLHPDILQKAIAHRWFAAAAYEANNSALALAEYSKAQALFVAAPQTVATFRGETDAEIWQALIEARKGDLQQADARLKRAEEELARNPIYSQEVSLYGTLAELKLRGHDSEGAELALRSAVFLAEWGLRSSRTQDARREWAERAAPTYRNLVLWKLRQGDNLGALELWEWYRGAEFRTRIADPSEIPQDLDLNAPPDIRTAPALPTPVTVVQQLPSLATRTVVAIAVFPEGTAVWAYDDRGVFHHWIDEPANKIRERVSGLRDLCSNRDASLTDLRSASSDLYRLLLGPIEDRIPAGRTLVFEPDDVFSDFPFEALIDSKGHYLIEDAVVATSPGLYRSLSVHPTSPISAQTPALVVSVSAPPVRNIDPIPAVQREAQSLVKRFRSVQWLDGTAATRAAIRHALSGVQLFHFAGHASAAPLRNGLLLEEPADAVSQVRVFGPADFSRATVGQLQLAVLAACETATHSTTDDSQTKSLSEALLRSGVPAVVASRWSVDSDATALLMSEFYKNLLSGNEVAASLRAAQLRLASLPGFNTPYYWAGFGAQGS